MESEQHVLITDWLIPAVYIQGPMMDTPRLTHLSPLKLRPQASSEFGGMVNASLRPRHEHKCGLLTSNPSAYKIRQLLIFGNEWE